MSKFWCKLFHRSKWIVLDSKAYSNKTITITYKCLKCDMTHEIDMF